MRVADMTGVRNERRRKTARILAVDDEPISLATLQAILVTENYQVDNASDGFDALMQLKRSLPDLVLSDLRMPQMSGFELLSIVRHRLPHIATIAMSGEVTVSAQSGLLTDVFLEKGTYSPAQLLTHVKDLLQRSPLRPRLPKLEEAPVWLPRTKTDDYGLTCSECLRFFLVRDGEPFGEPRRARCPFCNTELRYFVDPMSAARGIYKGEA